MTQLRQEDKDNLRENEDEDEAENVGLKATLVSRTLHCWPSVAVSTG